jgi:hypothetical protein
LTTAKHVDYPNYEALKKLITGYYYQSWIAGGTTNRVKQTSFNILKKTKNKESIEDIRNLIIENLQKYDDYKGLLSTDYAYWTNWLKPVLLAVEYFEHDEKEFIPISRDLHAEHILPAGWDRDGLDWSLKFADDEIPQILNSLGNLTLLSGAKNIQASNRNFVDKAEIYKGNNGKGFDGKTSFEITKKVIEDYSEWNKENVEKRYQWLVSRISEIFKIQ